MQSNNATNMTVRSQRRFVFFLILVAISFLSLQLSGISLQDFDNAGQMQENFALPTSRNRAGGAADGQLLRNTLSNLAVNSAKEQKVLKQTFYVENILGNANEHVILERDKMPTNHDRHQTDSEVNGNNLKIHIRNLASSKLRESVDQDSIAKDKKGLAISPPVTVIDPININITILQTMQSNRSKYEDEVRRLGNSYQVVPPSFLQEENCPVCFGTSLCDQFYAGNIKWDQQSTVEMNNKVHQYNGVWINSSLGKYLKVTIKKFSKHQMLDNYICQITSVTSASRRNSTGPLCHVSAEVMHTQLAKQSATQQEYVRTEIGKLQYRQNSLFSLSKCASQRLLDKLQTGNHSSDIAKLSTALILSPHTLLLQFINNHVPQLSRYFPSYYGACGHSIIQENQSYKPLQEFLPEPWLVRVDLALQILQMVEDFRLASPDWLVLFGNITYDNLMVTEEGSIIVVNLEDLMIVDRSEINQTLQITTPTKPTVPCNEECLFNQAASVSPHPDTECGNAYDYSQLMYMLVCQRFLSDLESTKVIRYFDHKDMDFAEHPGGLLRNPPYELDLRFTELLYECVFESKPGRRLIVSKTLKKMLFVIKRSKIGSAYW